MKKIIINFLKFFIVNYLKIIIYFKKKNIVEAAQTENERPLHFLHFDRKEQSKKQKENEHYSTIFFNKDGSPLAFNRPQKRNTICICGSGLKYKICCMQKDFNKMYKIN